MQDRGVYRWGCGMDGVVGLGIVAGAAAAPWLPEVPVWPIVGGTAWIAVALGLAGHRGIGWGAIGALLGWVAVLSQPIGPALDGEVAVQGVVLGAGLGRTADVRCVAAATAGSGFERCDGRVRVTFPEGSAGPGTPVLLRGVASPIAAQRALPGAPDPVRSAARSRVRTAIRAAAVRRLDGQAHARCPIDDPTGVLCAVSTGIRDRMDDGVVDVLRRTGTAHVLAISGFHVGVVALGTGGVLAALLRAIALVRPRGVSVAPAVVIGAAAGIAYAWTAGAPVSAQRAGLLLALAAIVRLSGGELRGVRLLGIAAGVVVLVDPAAAGGPAFQLSFGAVLGILRIGPRLAAYIPPDLPRPIDWGLRAMATSIAATIGTLAPSAWWFQQIAPASPIANLVALPWTAVAVVPPAMAAAFAPAPLSDLAAWIGTGSVRGLVAVLGPLAWEPWTPAVGPIGALALGCWLLLPRAPLRCAAVTAAALTLRPVATVDRVWFLDVGQGDSALVELADGGRWLIDGGLPGDAVVSWLRRQGIRHLDVVIATHGDADHVGGLGPVIDGLSIGALWVDGDGPTAERARSRGIDVVVRPSALLHPAADYAARNANDASCVLALAGVLFTGDVERDGERMVWAALPGPVPVLKVPHHGSKTSSSPLLLDGARPTVAVIGVGRENRYGHPNPGVLDRYAERGIAVYRTDRDGTMRVTVGDAAVEVETWRPGRGWSAPERWAIRRDGRIAGPRNGHEPGRSDQTAGVVSQRSSAWTALLRRNGWSRLRRSAVGSSGT